MAIDKNSKAYQSLITNGYTDEQITQMHDSVASGENAQNVVQNTQPANYDPMADLNPEYIANMDMNKQISGANQSFSQYWDDSSRDKQNTRGWLNEKYTWEWVKTSDINYNPDITTKDLNPNFVYGKQSQVYGTDHPGYISQRNDDIASALYNEWLTSREDVARFLMAQKWFMNSTEEDRLNTIESVWKRLWAIAWQNKPDPSKAEQILTDTSGELYGKVTADEWNPSEWIQTLSDENSVFRAMEETRVNNLKALINNNPADIATLELEWLSPFWEQTMRDARQYYPEFVAEIEAEKKKLLTQKNVNAISNWDEMVTNTEWQSNINNNINNFAASNATSTKSSAEITKDVNNAMAQSQTANEASETMAWIEEDMATLKNRLKNLRQEANAAFKWDVPDYLVNAYINNKTQEIQNQMSILEDRYNAAYQRYTTELQQKQWEKEYELKKEQLQLERDEFNHKKWMDTNWVSSSTTSTTSATATKNEGDSFEVTTMTDEQVAAAVDQLRDMYDNWQLWKAQCAAWIQKYYLPMLWISLPNISSMERKKSLINTDEGYTPKRWDLIILKGSSAEYWHIGIVMWVKSDWTIEYLDWNGSLWKDGKWTETVAVHGINPNSSSIVWFRNVNKWKWQSSSYNMEWTDFDYTNFENFMKATSKSEKEAIAAQYWTDLYWMTQIARNALSNRTSDSWWSYTPGERVSFVWDDWNMITYAEWVTMNDSRLNMAWFDPILWFNPIYAKTYKWIMEWKIDVADAAKNMWITEDQLRSEVRNYWTHQEQWWAVSEESSYSSSLLDLFAKLYNEAANDDWEVNFRPWRDWQPNTYRNLIYKQIKSAMTLEKMVEARSQNIWFWQVTEWEWRMLREAAGALWSSFWADDSALNKEFEAILKILRHDVYWQNNDWDSVKWKNFYEKAYWWTTTSDGSSYDNDSTKDALWIS